MSLNASKIESSGGTTQAPIEPGTYPARLVQVVDLGMQPQNPYQGEAKAPAYTISTTYELLDEFCLDEEGEELKDKPRWIFETYVLHNPSADLAKSTKRYLALDPNIEKGWEWPELVGTPCTITLYNKESKGKVYTNVSAVGTMRPKEAAKAAELVNPTTVFALDDPDLKVFSSLSDYIKGLITSNLEYKGSKLEVLLLNETKSDGEEKDDSKPEEGTTDGSW